MTKSKNAETLVLHGGTYRSDPATGSVAVPIYQTTSYQFRDTEHAANLFALKELGNIYTRIMNPTTDVLEQRIAALEGGVAALAVSSGQAASAMAVQNIAHAGDNIVSSTDLYGGTWNLFANTFRTMGIEVRFVDPADPEAFRRATDAHTRAYYAETLPNPKLTVFPIAEVAAIGQKLGVPLIMDNTAAPVLCQPLRPWRSHRRPFDDQIHRRPWHLDRRHDRRWRQFRLGAPCQALPAAQPARPQLPRRRLDRGGQAAGPDRLYPQGARHLAARSRRIHEPVQCLPVHPGAGDPAACACASIAAMPRPWCDIWRAGPRSRVIHPGMHKDPEQKRRTETYLKGGHGGLVGFELKGGKEAGRRFIDALKMLYHVANIGDVRSLAIHPASTTHSQLSPEEQSATGVTAGYVRLSVGIEHIDDILADLDRGLAASRVIAAAAA